MTRAFEQAPPLSRNDTGLDFPAPGARATTTTLAHRKGVPQGAAPRCGPPARPSTACSALGIPWAPEWANEDDDNRGALCVFRPQLCGIGCLLFFRLYSDAIKQARRPVGHRFPPSTRWGLRPARLPRRRRHDGATAAAEFFAGGPTAGTPPPPALFLLPARRQLRRLRGLRRHALQAPQHLVVNRVDYAGLDLRARRRGGGTASCGYGAAGPRAAAGAQSFLRPAAGKEGAAFRAPRLVQRRQVAAGLPMVAFSFLFKNEAR